MGLQVRIDSTGKKPMTNRARKRARRFANKTHRVLSPHGFGSVPVRRVRAEATPAEKRRVKRVERRQRVALVMCDKLKIPKQLHYLDYRYWQARACFGMDANEPDVYSWWCRLHWKTREEIHTMSRVWRRLSAA